MTWGELLWAIYTNDFVEALMAIFGAGAILVLWQDVLVWVMTFFDINDNWPGDDGFGF